MAPQTQAAKAINETLKPTVEHLNHNSPSLSHAA
jgi:hypothetical protein